MSESKKLEWVRLFIDFIGKVSYPLVILVLVFYIIENSQFQSLLNKLTGAKLGNTEFTFQVIEDKAANEARLNAHIQELQRKTQRLEQELKVLLQQDSQATNLVDKARLKTVEAEATLADNSQYSVLVFNKPSQIIAAGLIVDMLLKAGYSSSRTTTDLSELSTPLPNGTLYITRNSEGDKIISKIISDLKTMNPDFVIHQPEAIQPLRRGNVQISLF